MRLFGKDSNPVPTFSDMLKLMTDSQTDLLSLNKICVQEITFLLEKAAAVAEHRVHTSVFGVCPTAEKEMECEAVLKNIGDTRSSDMVHCCKNTLAKDVCAVKGFVQFLQVGRRLALADKSSLTECFKEVFVSSASFVRSSIVAPTKASAWFGGGTTKQLNGRPVLFRNDCDFMTISAVDANVSGEL